MKMARKPNGKRVDGSTSGGVSDQPGVEEDMDQLEIVSRSPEQTQRIGSIIGEMVEAGDLILLLGNLGAGKTCLTQGIAWFTGSTQRGTSSMRLASAERTPSPRSTGVTVASSWRS